MSRHIEEQTTMRLDVCLASSIYWENLFFFVDVDDAFNILQTKGMSFSLFSFTLSLRSVFFSATRRR